MRRGLLRCATSVQPCVATTTVYNEQDAGNKCEADKESGHAYAKEHRLPSVAAATTAVTTLGAGSGVRAFHYD
eukprot:CAMPEP_0170737736 /NCGR_PEP_ID=MMETSP0437-20130122/4279_1 /TAXON_ID=0 /ORGANISM="Sexangularia sp." /LENGTH=72 /DNA_ID=CAMNT_0011076129 /DNA_START=218 /DNA_END=436 /DNA_ORIENTATION=+